MSDKRISLVAGGMVLLAIFLVAGVLLYATAQNQPPQGRERAMPTHTTQKPSSVATLPPGDAGRLVIPSLALSAPIERVGVLPSGEMSTPQQRPYQDVGWYKGGTKPGEDGSAVIAGHVDAPQGKPAVFARLHELKIGDTMQVERGNVVHFRVQRMAYYTPQGAPMREIFTASGGAHLNLITCAGQWIPEQRQTTLRLVVYAEKV